MPKAARRSSAPRAEPYPATKRSSPNSAMKRTPSNKKILTEKSASEKNIPVNSPVKPEKPLDASENKATESPNKESSERPTSFLTQPLEDEDENGNLPIYDTCSTVCQKINALLGKDNTKEENLNPAEATKDGKNKPFTKASFVRALNDIGGECPTRSLDTFLKTRKIKTMGGAESPVYPAAYKFFEKKRVFEGKKKNAARLKVEENRPDGLPLRDPNKMYILCLPGENTREFADEYGQ